MDLGFFHRAERMLADRVVPHLDYGVLVATLSAVQGADAAEHADRRRAREDAEQAEDHASLVELLAGGPGWREAVIRQAGSFNRRITVARDKEA